MATKLKIKKKKPSKSAAQVIPLEDKNPPVVVSGAEDENILDTTLQDEPSKPAPPSPGKYRKKKRDKSIEKKKKLEGKQDDKDDKVKTEPPKEKGSQEVDNDSVTEKNRSRPGTPSSRPGTPSSRPGTPTSLTSPRVRRSPSPFNKNVVEPLPQGGTSNMGSAVSIRSTLSAREAWTDRSETPTGSKQRPSSAKSTSTIVSRIDKNGKEKEEDALSLRSRSGLEIEGPEQHAYIPYLYARNTISRIMDDMTNMKTNHVRIVHDIDKHYRAIEDETQTQFNTFVLCLREQYSGKVTTFRQVIDIHRTELSKKEVYWNEVLASLTERNNRLLKDKKVLLIKNKVEIDRLEKEKSEVTTHFTQLVDKASASAVIAGKEHEEQISQMKTDNAALLAEMESLKIQMSEQDSKMSTIVPVGAAVVAATPPSSAQTSEAQTQTDVERRPAAIVGTVVVRDSEQQEREKEHIDGERQEMTDERQSMEEERERLAEERKSWVAEINKLQAELALVSKDRAEWQVKYEVMKSQAGDAATLHTKYMMLENQYAALSAVVAASDTSKTAAEESSKKTAEEKAMMATEQARLEAEIKKYEADFRKKNGHPPTEKDKSDSDKEMYTQLEEVNTVVTSLDKKIETLEHVKAGNVPPPPEVAPTPVVIKDPEVKTVEVLVPDPSIVAALEKAQQELSALQTQLSDLQQEKSLLHTQISSLNTDLSESRGKIVELERLLDEGDGLDGVAVAAAANVAASAESEEKVSELTSQLAERDDELERLRRENREMQKDMKKMIKRYEKLQAKLKKMEVNEGASALLQVVVAMAHEVHGKVPAAAEEVDTRLKSEEEDVKKLKESQNENQKALDTWAQMYKKKHKKEATPEDRDAECVRLQEAVDVAVKEVDDSGRRQQALTMLQTGVVKVKELQQQRPASAARVAKETEQEMSTLDEKVIDLESETEALKDDKTRLEDIRKELESQLQLLQDQVALQGSLPDAGQPSEDLSDELASLQKEIDALNTSLREEKAAHDKTRDELEEAKSQAAGKNEELAGERADLDAKIDQYKKIMEAKLKGREEELANVKQRTEELEAERLANVPVDTAKEMKNLQNKISLLEKDKTGSSAAVAGLEAQLTESQNKVKLSTKNLETQRATNRELESKVKAARSEKEQAVRELTNQLEKKELQRSTLEKKVKQLQTQVPVKPAGAVTPAAGGRAAPADKGLKDQLLLMKRENTSLNTRIKQMEVDSKKQGKSDGDSAADKNMMKRHEKILKELEKKLEWEKNRTEKLTESLRNKEEEAKDLGKTCGKQETELKKLRDELAALGIAAKEGVEAATKVKDMERDFKRLAEENKTLTENFNSERVLRKKYYNMVEDMKGKIRVYCRARPLSGSEKDRGNFSVLKSADEYSIEVSSQRGIKEFQFDQVFMESSTQEKIFEDTNNLIQSAVDGYNVCIFAYGQTGSGKTFTMIGDKEQNHPGIAPRAFNRIFELAQENRSKMSMKVTCYMMELYNEKLIDLFGRPGQQDDDKLDIKKDKKGMVFVQGAMVKEASNTKELFALFEEGSKNRHTASTKMNAESSRSHLVIGIVLESTNKVTGHVLKGKLSLVDLAGSERVGKTGAGAEQLKEAMSINKSLSALGDVISALSSEQSFIPYRNNKLTMLMQDSLGGNAKTLMFVNISPADYNTDETVISLTYASRVKLITNDASKNADNKEILRLKAVIQKMKKGEAVEEEEQ
ncbi:uncharacterized protein [Haliotis cracherodii]|uniref:uncharacterized protein n=1 Tax=Haliotis cracherodii TaxID=6455 RepID=UPI0039E9ED67